MSKAKPADQGVEILTWLHPLDATIIENAAGRGEGTRSGIIRECVALCLHFGLRPWRALNARAAATSAMATLDEMEHAIREHAADDQDLLSMLDCVRADLRSAYLPDGDLPTPRLKAPPERGPGKG